MRTRLGMAVATAAALLAACTKGSGAPPTQTAPPPATSTTDDPVLAEMAREVRSGRMTLLEASTSLAYRDTFAAVADRIVTHFRSMSRDELAKIDGDKVVDELLARHEHEEEEPEPPAENRKQRQATGEEEEYDFTNPITQRSPRPVDHAPDGQSPRRARWTRRWSS